MSSENEISGLVRHSSMNSHGSEDRGGRVRERQNQLQQELMDAPIQLRGDSGSAHSGTGGDGGGLANVGEGHAPQLEHRLSEIMDVLQPVSSMDAAESTRQLWGDNGSARSGSVESGSTRRLSNHSGRRRSSFEFGGTIGAEGLHDRVRRSQSVPNATAGSRWGMALSKGAIDSARQLLWAGDDLQTFDDPELHASIATTGRAGSGQHLGRGGEEEEEDRRRRSSVSGKILHGTFAPCDDDMVPSDPLVYEPVAMPSRNRWSLMKELGGRVGTFVRSKKEKNNRHDGTSLKPPPPSTSGLHDSLRSLDFEESISLNIAPRGLEDGTALPVQQHKTGNFGFDLSGILETCSSATGGLFQRKRCLLIVALAAIAVGTTALVKSKGSGGSNAGSAAASLGVSPNNSGADQKSEDPTGVFDRLSAIRSRIVDSGHTSADMLNQDSTAQFKALLWISEWDGARLTPEDDMLLQRYALGVFFFSTNAAGGEAADSAASETDGGTGKLGEAAETEVVLGGEEVWMDWMTARGFCYWAGVQCHHREGTDIDDTTYDGNNGVTHLNLTANGVRGTLPSELSALSDLRVLDLMDNAITGTLPADLGSLTHMISLSLTNNDISGSIPSELGRLTSMTHLYLDQNVLEGDIPEELGNIESMHVMGLHENTLTGKFPPIQKMKSLRSLFFDNNQLTGPLPGEVIGALTAIEDLRLGSNNFTGPVPSQIGDLKLLSVLYLEYNALTGVIPWEISKLKELYALQLHENYLTGTIPYQFGELGRLEVLSLDHNELTGTIPASLRNMDDLMVLYLQGNKLTGKIPPVLDRLEDLIDLRLDSNQLSGTVPHDIQRLYKLEWLHLNDNAFTGAVPPGLGELQRLRGMRLNGNMLEGEMPDGVCSLKISGDLKLLHADCAGVEPLVVCDCCTECFD